MRTKDDRYFSGEALYGDDLDAEQVRRWLAEEEEGYYNLVHGYYFSGDSDYRYEYHARNRYHAYRHLGARSFGQCLALGCARGDDVAPLAPRVGRFLCVEPARRWWRDAIAGTPARYVAPDASGRIDCADGENDLAVCLSVLHHVPNVTAVLGEVARAVSRGGLFVLHEPVVSMGDWRARRPGLTKNERGLPLGWLERTLRAAGFAVERRAFCGFPATARLGALLRTSAFNSPLLVRLDAAASSLLAWNLRYHRDAPWKKLSPTSAFFLLRRQ